MKKWCFCSSLKDIPVSEEDRVVICIPAKATAPSKILGQSGESKAVNRRQVRREPARERGPSPTPLSMQRGGSLHSNATENLSEGP